MAFRGGEAAAVLELTRSVELAQRELQALPTGGRTPLGRWAGGRPAACWSGSAAGCGIPCPCWCSSPTAGPISAGAATRVEEALRAARRVAEAHIPAVVIDTERQFVSLGLAAQVAQVMGAPATGWRSCGPGRWPAGARPQPGAG